MNSELWACSVRDVHRKSWQHSVRGCVPINVRSHTFRAVAHRACTWAAHVRTRFASDTLRAAGKLRPINSNLRARDFLCCFRVFVFVFFSRANGRYAYDFRRNLTILGSRAIEFSPSWWASDKNTYMAFVHVKNVRRISFLNAANYQIGSLSLSKADKLGIISLFIVNIYIHM